MIIVPSYIKVREAMLSAGCRYVALFSDSDSSKSFFCVGNGAIGIFCARVAVCVG